jgi:hypothetical protein
MNWLDPALSRLADGNSQLLEVAAELKQAWDATEALWKDQRAREFQRRCIDPLPAAFSQASAAIVEFCETARHTAQTLDDPATGGGL